MNYNYMTGDGSMMFFSWITYILVIALIILGIAALWKYINKNNMINTKHLFKVASAWISAVYVVCYAGVAIYPPIRGLFMRYSLHTDVFSSLIFSVSSTSCPV